MSTVHIELGPKSRDGKIVIDGYDIAGTVQGFHLSAEANRTPRLELDLRVHDVTTFESPHAQVLIDPTAAGFLERAGWTPPPGQASVLERDADGCPCERHTWWELPSGEMVKESTAGAERKTILGRTVPTCPVHCPKGTALHRARVEAYGQGRDDEGNNLDLMRYEGR